MTPENFCFWLQGFDELCDSTLPTLEQWKSISDHLALVFTKLTPPVNFHDKTEEIKLPDWSDLIPKQPPSDWYRSDPNRPVIQPYFLDPYYKPGVLTC